MKFFYGYFYGGSPDPDNKQAKEDLKNFLIVAGIFLVFCFVCICQLKKILVQGNSKFGIAFLS